MTWQLVVELEAPALHDLVARLRELGLSADVNERVRTSLAPHFSGTPPQVGVWVADTLLTHARNYFVVEIGAAGQPRLELYLY